MEQKVLHSGSVRIFVSDREMNAFGISFRSLDIHTEATRTFLAAVILAADSSGGLDPSRLTVEIFPVEGGCVLLLSPPWVFRRRVRHKSGAPLIYRLESENELLGFARGWRRLYPPPAYLGCTLGSSSLYAFAGGYHLVLYPVAPLTAAARHLLSEWGTKIGTGESVAAFTAEHGVALCIGDALPRLCGITVREACPPTLPDSPR